MKKRKLIYVEIDGVFHDSLILAGKAIKCYHKTVYNRCLSNKFPNYKIVPFRITYTKKKCITCGKINLLENFVKDKSRKDGYKNQCKQCKAKCGKKYYQTNTEQCIKNREKWQKNNSNHRKERKKVDIVFKLNVNISSAISRSLKGGKGGAHWEDLVGYELSDLMERLESKFTEGMTWENYGKGKYKWSLDHIIAKTKFNITSAKCQEFKDCWSLDNLQPLWDARNTEKGDRPMHPKYLIKPF